FTLDEKFRDTYAEHWNLGVQHEIGGLTIDVSYVGNHTLKARRIRNIDQPVGGVLPYPQFSRIFISEQAGSSNYKPIQAKVERRFSRGLTFISSYTLGHAIDDRPGQGAGRVQDFYNMRAERGDADFDVRHHWTFSGLYEIPFGRDRRWGANWSSITTALL